MKLDTEYNSLALSMAELATLGREIGTAPNALSLLPSLRSDEKESIMAGFNRLKKADRQMFSSAVSALAAPAQTIRLNYTIGDSLLMRLFLAWPQEGKDTLASLSLTGNRISVSQQPVDKIEAVLSGALAVNAPLFSANLGVTLSSSAVIVLIAVMDYFRYSSFHSLLTHTVPMTSFILPELIERIADTSSEDFRWPLLLLDKVLPVHIASSFTKAVVLAALEELCKAGLIAKNVSEDNRTEYNLYSLKGISETISYSLLHDVSKVALCTSSERADGKIGHEAMLLVRDSSYLWLFGISGNEGMVASIDRVQFGELLKKVLAPPEKKTPLPATSDTSQVTPGKAKKKSGMHCAYHADREPVATCVSCGKLICADCKSTLGGKMYCSPCADTIFMQKNKSDNA